MYKIIVYGSKKEGTFKIPHNYWYDTLSQLDNSTKYFDDSNYNYQIFEIGFYKDKLITI